MSNFKKFMLIVSVGIIALISEFVFHQQQLAFWLIVVVGGITTISMLLGMIETLKSGSYGVDILAITAIVATLLVGEYWASLMVLIMLTGGDSLEDYASRQAGRELEALLSHSPQIAHKVIAEKIEDIPVNEVKIGDYILVKPGELVPVDGKVSEGSSFFDESSLTGESRPVAKTIDDELMSGSVNGDGAIYFTVTKEAKDSQYQRLVKLVEESKAKPAHFVRLADEYALPFTIIAYVIGGLAWFISKDPVRFAEVLVVASPCPLILAAPVALVAGMSRSSKNGIVVKNGTTIEKLAKAKSIAFDKTGTLTEGKLNVAEILPFEKQTDEKELLQIAASVERQSTHILARSLVVAANEEKISFLPVNQIEEVTGQGVTGNWNGKEIRVGKREFAYAPEEKDHLTKVFVAVDGKYLGEIIFQDIVREEAKSTITDLRSLGFEKLLMVTGDHETIAKEIGDKVGISEVHAKCLPEEKIALLKAVPENLRPIVMVGDGVNDAPALSIADVGIAMGAHGSTAASESADAVILKDDLSKVSQAVEISKNTMKIARQSVLIGIFICVVLMIIASFGVIPALIGAMLQEVIDTVSILSALRAKKETRWKN